MIETLFYGPWHIGATYENVILHFGKRRFVVDLRDAFRANRLALKHYDVSFQMFEEGFLGTPIEPISFQTIVDIETRVNGSEPFTNCCTLLHGYLSTRMPSYANTCRTFEVTIRSQSTGLMLAHAYGMRTHV